MLQKIVKLMMVSCATGTLYWSLVTTQKHSLPVSHILHMKDSIAGWKQMSALKSWKCIPRLYYASMVRQDLMVCVPIPSLILISIEGKLHRALCYVLKCCSQKVVVLIIHLRFSHAKILHPKSLLLQPLWQHITRFWSTFSLRTVCPCDRSSQDNWRTRFKIFLPYLYPKLVFFSLSALKHFRFSQGRRMRSFLSMKPFILFETIDNIFAGAQKRCVETSCCPPINETNFDETLRLIKDRIFV